MTESKAFARTICSICYEDLKPIVEDIQSIPICGHVFHELCLQQWLEYCANGKQNCPVCKQNCSGLNACRLYFQSIGDANDLVPPKTAPYFEQDPDEVQLELKRSQVKVSSLNSLLEAKQKDFGKVNEELYACKEQVKKEEILKNEALQQKSVIEHSLRLKSVELDRLASDFKELQGRNMSLAKELAELKLVSDMNLEEEEVLRLATLGNEGNSRETIDILKKSLVIRNRSYKELMSKCNVLGRGEARCVGKLMKAKEKIKELRERIRELETAHEVRDNEGLRISRILKEVSLKDTSKRFNLSVNLISANGYLAEDKDKNSAGTTLGFGESKSLSCCGKTNQCISSRVSANNTNSNIIDEDEPGSSAHVNGLWHFGSKSRKTEKDRKKSLLSITKSVSDTKLEGYMHQQSSTDAISCPRSDECYMTSASSVTVNEDVLFLDSRTEYLPSSCIGRDTPAVRVSQPGDHCFAGGLMGPDGTNWHLGKWCKRVQNKKSKLFSAEAEGLVSNKADLVAVGADGRGGQIKRLRSLNQHPSDNETLTWSKRCKHGSSKSGLQLHGCLQIEHFFGSAVQK